MWASVLNILRLVGKELRAIWGDKVMVLLIVYLFTAAVWMVAQAVSTDIRDLPVAVVDEDHSPLSAHLVDSIRPPLFRSPDLLDPDEAHQAQLDGDYVLVLSIPPDFEADLRNGRNAELMILVDATAVAFAGNGATFLSQQMSEEVSDYLAPGTGQGDLVEVVFRSRFNPNMTGTWFSSVMQIMNDVTILMLVLSGSSMIREREHGTIEHVLVMPVRPHEIILSKILANGLVVLVASVVSLLVVVEGLLGVPVAGALMLYMLGAGLYVIAMGAVGLMLASFCHNMGQFGLLVIPAIMIIQLLSGGMTPLESMPDALRVVMRTISPATHFVTFAQSVLYRGAGLDAVLGQMAAISAMAAVALALVLVRFRKILS